jgi:hypothetical protein
MTVPSREHLPTLQNLEYGLLMPSTMTIARLDGTCRPYPTDRSRPLMTLLLTSINLLTSFR